VASKNSLAPGRSGIKYRYATRLSFALKSDKCTNNIAEYKVVIHRLRKLRALRVTTCIVKTNSKIVTGQIKKLFHQRVSPYAISISCAKPGEAVQKVHITSHRADQERRGRHASKSISERRPPAIRCVLPHNRHTGVGGLRLSKVLKNMTNNVSPSVIYEQEPSESG
jgi:ribonuclease HI